MRFAPTSQSALREGMDGSSWARRGSNPFDAPRFHHRRTHEIAAESRAYPMHGLGVELTGARLCHTEEFAYFAKTAIFLVVQTKHGSQALGKCVDGFGNPFDEFSLRSHLLRRSKFRAVLD